MVENGINRAAAVLRHRGIKMRREPVAGETGILQIFGINHYRRWYLPFWVWLIGLAICYFPIVPAMFWMEIFTVEGINL